jgi:hypothetical protein
MLERGICHGRKRQRGVVVWRMVAGIAAALDYLAQEAGASGLV